MGNNDDPKRLCSKVVRELIEDNGWLLLPEDVFIEAVLVHAPREQTMDPESLRKWCINTYCRQALYPVCLGTQGRYKRKRGFRELAAYLHRVALRAWPEVAEDATQESIIMVYEKVTHCRNPGTFLAFAIQQLRDAARKFMKAEAREDSLDALLEQDFYGDVAADAGVHVEGAVMKEFARALLSKQGDKLTCSACQALLAEYVDAQIMGVEPGEELAEIEPHLGICPLCARAYRELMSAMALAYTEKLPQPASRPQFDFSFLRAEPEKPSFRWDELGRLIIEFSADLLRALQPAPATQLAYVGVKDDKSRRTLCQFALKEAHEDLEVTVTAEETQDDPTQCTVVVEVDIPSRGGWPNLAGIELTLKRGEQELETQKTDAFGKAVFEGVSTDDLAHLVFEITPFAS